MSTESIEVNDTPQINETAAQPELNKTKSNWYTKIRDNPIELENFRQKRRERYQALKLIRESLPPDQRPEKKPTKHYIITPEAKRRYNIKYYSTHKEKVDKYVGEYLKKERAKENSKLAEYYRQHQKKKIRGNN